MLRAVTSGFLPGDDWTDEFEAMTLGGEMYFRTLVEYLTYFAGRFAAPVTAFGGRARPGPATGRCCAAHSACPRRRARRPAPIHHRRPIGSVDGVVYFANARTIGIRTQDALYRFLRGFGKPALAAHQLFAEDADPAQTQLAWESWLSRTLA